MKRGRWWDVIGIAWTTMVLLAVAAAPASAKPWKKWAPAPLASDSSFAAMQGRSLDSLSAMQYKWLEVQRDWRGDREAEGRRPVWPDELYEHRARRTDKRFAELASKPYEALADSEKTWLVAENAAQREARESVGSAAGIFGGVLVGAVLGAIAGVAILAAALAHSWGS
jgi:hypothetical protein